MLKINNTIYEYIKKKSFNRHIGYALFILPFSLASFIGGVGFAMAFIYFIYQGDMSIFTGISFMIISLIFALIGFYWSKSIIERFTNPVSSYLIKNPQMIVFVKIAGIKTSLSFVPIIGITSYKLILYTSDLKMSYISISKDKISEIYAELQRVLPHAKFGDTSENSQWYNENYLFKDCNSWYQREFTRSLKEA